MLTTRSSPNWLPIVSSRGNKISTFIVGNVTVTYTFRLDRISQSGQYEEGGGGGTLIIKGTVVNLGQKNFMGVFERGPNKGSSIELGFGKVVLKRILKRSPHLWSYPCTYEVLLP